MKNLNKIIREEILREINDIYNGNLQDEDCPLIDKVWDNGFTIREMLQYDNSYDRLEYANSKLDCLGQGKRRTVFKLNDAYILKLTNGSHRFQTKNEYDSASMMTDRYDLFPRMIYQSRDFTWTISEYAKPLDDMTCQRILGIPLYGKSPNKPSLEGFQLWAETKGRQPSRQYASKLGMTRKNNCDDYYNELVKTNSWFKAFYKLEHSQRGDLDYGTDINPSGYDFRGENLGYVKRNGKDFVVILDGGFIKPFDTRKLKSKYGINSHQINDDFYE